MSQAGFLAQSLRRNSLHRPNAGQDLPLLYPPLNHPSFAGPSRRPSSHIDQRPRSRGRLLRKEAGPNPERIPTEAGDLHGPERREPFHAPVLLREVLDALTPQRGGLFVDATVGLGGHAEAILAASPGVHLIAADRDADSLAIAMDRLGKFGDRVEFVHSDFRALPEILAERGNPRPAGILADLGISSYQLSVADRGLSFQIDGPLDMRMDRSRGVTAASLIEDASEQDLARIFFEYADERRSRRIARAIVRERRVNPIRTTLHLAEVVARAAGRTSRRIHPATRVFQALRIAVNGELEGLDGFLTCAAEALQVGGRLAVLTFHSLEDSITKKQMRMLAFRCSCSKSLPHCACGQPNLLRLMTRKALRPSAEEVEANPRSRSARLRAAERI